MASYNYVDNINSNLICCICRAPFLSPVVTTTCSHTFCRECITRSLDIQHSCPVDRSPLSVDDLKPENLLLRNMVDELMVECSQRSAGCQYTCQRQLLNVHLRDSCQYVQVACSEEGCDQMVLRKDMGNHSHDCVHRGITCDACGSAVKAFDLDTHNTECSALEDTCTACSLSIRRIDMQQHMAVCLELLIPCSQSSNGCPWTGPRRSLEDSHLPQCPYESMKGFFAINDDRMATLRNENAVLRERLFSTESTLYVLKGEMETTKRIVGAWWRPNSTTSNLYSNNPSTLEAEADHEQRSQETLRYHPSRHPLAPILSFTADSPVARPEDLERSPSSSSSTTSFSDPAFFAQYFPSVGSGSSLNGNASENNGSTSYANGPNSGTAQLDPVNTVAPPPVARALSSFPYPPGGANRPYAGPLRFSDNSHGLQPTSSTNAGNYGYYYREAPHSLTTSIAPIDFSASTIEGSLSGIRNSVVSVSASLDALARRQDIALTTENLRMNEEVGALRAIVHGLRMQVHALITERNGLHAWDPTTVTTTRYYNHAPPPPQQPLVINSTTSTTKL